MPAARLKTCATRPIFWTARASAAANSGLSVYPSSQPVNLELTRNGVMARLMTAGATIRTAFCGPCFGAGDVPANNALSIRHTTRNFPNREGSKPGDGQIAAVALMDARSIAATAARGRRAHAATDLDVRYENPKYYFDRASTRRGCTTTAAVLTIRPSCSSAQTSRTGPPCSRSRTTCCSASPRSSPTR